MKIKIFLNDEESYSNIGFAKAVIEISHLQICDILEISQYLQIYSKSKEIREFGGAFLRETENIKTE